MFWSELVNEGRLSLGGFPASKVKLMLSNELDLISSDLSTEVIIFFFFKHKDTAQGNL